MSTPPTTTIANYIYYSRGPTIALHKLQSDEPVREKIELAKINSTSGEDHRCDFDLVSNVSTLTMH
jgi:hypothetical protein